MEFVTSLWHILCEMSPYILLGFFIAGLLQVYVDRHTMARQLAGRGAGPVVKAALFGIPLPLCSCGVLPTAVSLRRRGASKGATTSFLIATPQTGVDSIAATYSLLGPAMAVIRPVAALVGAVFGGLSVSRWGDEDSIDSDIADYTSEYDTPSGFFAQLWSAVRYGFVDMVASVGGWLVIGLFIAALITMFVPDEFFVSLSRYPLLAMLAVVAVAVPMYVCATGSIPIAMSLMIKGLSPGIAFVLLMAGPAANFASIIILSRTQGRRATAIYLLSVVVTAIAFGMLIDLLMPREWFALGPVGNVSHHSGPGIFSTICSCVLGALLIYTLIIKRYFHKNNQNITKTMEHKFKVTGMNCPHCSASVERAIQGVEGVTGVKVNLSGASATITGEANPQAVINAVRLAGFECEPIS